MSIIGAERPRWEDVRKYPHIPIYLPPDNHRDARSDFVGIASGSGFLKYFDHATSGCAEAQAVVALNYLLGNVTCDDNMREAQFWAEHSAGSESAYGQWVLAWVFLEQKRTKAGMQFMNKSAQQKFSPALYYMGYFYAWGIGVGRDVWLAKNMMVEAHQSGHQYAFTVLMQIYRMGFFGLFRFLQGLVMYPLSSLRAIFTVFTSSHALKALIYVRGAMIAKRIHKDSTTTNK